MTSSATYSYLNSPLHCIMHTHKCLLKRCGHFYNLNIADLLLRKDLYDVRYSQCTVRGFRGFSEKSLQILAHEYQMRHREARVQYKLNCCLIDSDAFELSVWNSLVALNENDKSLWLKIRFVFDWIINIILLYIRFSIIFCY